MSTVEIGDLWTTIEGPEYPAEVVARIEDGRALFQTGGGWVIDRMTAPNGWKRIVPAREVEYQKRIADLQDTVDRITAAGVENAARYAADLDRERRAGAAAVERIRAALLEGATDETQQWATTEALENVASNAHPGTLYRLSRAYLALSASHAEARALLSNIGERALALLGKGGA